MANLTDLYLCHLVVSPAVLQQKMLASLTLSKAGKPKDTDGPVREANCEDCLKRVRRGSG